VRSPATTHISRWVVVRNALGNANLVKAEAAIAVGVLGHVAWGATMLVVTFDQLGPIGPGWYLMVRQIAGAVGAPMYTALAGRFRHERVLAGAFLAKATAVALAIPVLEFHIAKLLLFIPIAIEGFTHTAPRALHDALLPWLADSPAQLVASNSFSALLDTAAALVGASLAATGLWLSGPSAVLAIVAILGVLGAWPLLAAAANQLADALIAVPTAKGDVVVRQGDPAEDMVLIDSGVFDTIVDGQHVRTLQHDDYFGEIALLFNAPRTATVQCAQAGALWRLRRDDFLRAITGNLTTEAAVKAIADQRLAHAGAVDLAQGDGR
jgi:hypothetical protein